MLAALHNYAGIQVTTGKVSSAQFINRAIYHQGGAKFSKSAHSKTYIFNLHDLEGILHVMIKHTFIQFGDRWFWQNIGIPMGIGPAPFFRLRDDAGALDIFEAFKKLTNCFVDNGYFFNNPFIHLLLHDDMIFRGHAGLYDRCLVHKTLARQQLVNPKELPYLDILITYRIIAGFYRIMTNLYDKRLQLGFAALPTVLVSPLPSLSRNYEGGSRT